jgi:hypothetical protein
MKEIYSVPTERIYVFRMDPTTSSDYFPIQNLLISFL